MDYFKNFRDRVINVDSGGFDTLAIELFHYQAVHNGIYTEYLKHLGCNIDKVDMLEKIPFLPIEFFKHHTIKTQDFKEEVVFESSGTTGMARSKHFIRDISLYNQLSKRSFETVFGPLPDYQIVALLPSYVERSNSSLIHMVDYFISLAREGSGFYSHNYEQLRNHINTSTERIILFCVTFALLELANTMNIDLRKITVIETGGMKGMSRELTREELYETITSRLNAQNVYSEYGMTELLSQAYGENGIFTCSPAMKVLIREISDPFTYLEKGKTGGINVVDLTNIHSCAFIETKDLGKVHHDGTFEVLGRFDNSDIRGCNLLLS